MDAAKRPIVIKSVAAMTFYVTTPIYYVNAQPHLGHAYTTIAADVLARHMRQRGEDVFFLTGTDEHGEPVADAAQAQGLEPKALADLNAEKFKALAPVLEATNDFFIRTTDEEHERRVQEVLQRVHDNGYTHKGIYEGWYCPRCADFKVENEILEGNRCPIHEIVLERHQEENWFFELSAFQERLEQLFDGQRDFVMPPHHFNEARSFIASGLQDISLSRKRLKWGVTVPWDPEHVFYVWFDALLNYYTALGYARPGRGSDRPVLARDVSPDRQGHPQVPHDLLARDADGGRSSGPRARVRPRLPARLRRPQDEQVARQRARPVRGHRPVRHRRAALLPDARRVVRRRRRGGDRRGALPLRERARQRVRQPGEPDDRDAAPLPRRRRFRRWRPTRRWWRSSTDCRRRSPDCSTASRSPRRSS